jgi:hypothetical protein
MGINNQNQEQTNITKPTIQFHIEEVNGVRVRISDNDLSEKIREKKDIITPNSSVITDRKKESSK